MSINSRFGMESHGSDYAGACDYETVFTAATLPGTRYYCGMPVLGAEPAMPAKPNANKGCVPKHLQHFFRLNADQQSRIKRTMEDRGITRADIRKRLGWSASKVQEVLTGTSGVTPEGYAALLEALEAPQ